jgi:hypothetical protein
LHLRLQASGDEESLAALLLTPRGMVPLPPIPLDPPEAHGMLRILLERWQRTLRFAYVIERPGAEPAAVQDTFQALLAALDRFWRQPGWAPLHQALADNPGLPLCLEIPPPPGATPQPRHPLALAEQLPWEHLPLNQRPIWRVRSAAASLPPRSMGPQWRRPRLLLITGPSKGLDLKEQIERLEALNRAGRISLHTLTGEQSSTDVALQSLREPQGWDGLIYLGHGDPSPEGGGGLRLERGMLAGAVLAEALRQAAPQLVLLSRCHGTDLVPLCLEAGVSWVWTCRGEVSDPIAVAAFVALLEALEAGHSLPAATAIAGQAIEREFPGSSGMISLEGRADSPPLRLPLRRRRLWSQRLARSQRRQLVATGVALGLGLVAYWPDGVTGYRSVLANRLLASRLKVQTAWRDLRGMPPTPGDEDQTSPLVVWLLNNKVAYPEGKRVSREVLATVLRALPPERAPVVGIDVVLDDDGPQPVQPVATKALAALIETQRRKVLFNTTVHNNRTSERPGARGLASLPSPALRHAGMKSFDGTVGIPENSLCTPQCPPHQLVEAVGRNSFFGVLAFGGPAKADGEGLPAGSVIDWSIDWLAPSVIQVVWIGEERFKSLRSAAPPLPPGARVLVGVDRRGLAGEGASKGSPEPAADLYPVPDALIDQPSWQDLMKDDQSWLNSEGDKNHLPGPLLQAVWSESLRRGHWLTPLAPLPTMALASGLGVLLAAALERRRHHLLALTLISLLAVPVSLELALSLRVLVPLLFPLGALWASCLSRRERDG